MKILLCAKHLVGSGGQEGFLRRLCSFLLTRGHQVEIIAAAADPVPNAAHTSVAVPWWVSRAAWDWAAARSVAAESRHHPCDVSLGGQKTWNCNVVRPGGGVEADYWSVRLSDRYAWPWVRALARLTSVKRRFDLDAESRVYRDPALRYVVANSTMVRDGLLRLYPLLAGKIHVVYNGADLARFTHPHEAGLRARVHAELGLNPELLTTVFAGHNFRLKGLPQALTALELAGRGSGASRPQLIVMGGGHSQRVRPLVQRLGLTEVVRFVGDARDPRPYYAAADVLVLPTYYDPCANVTFEALASGIPVITTRRNGASEVITDGREGWTVDHPDCVDQLASHIKALRDPNQRAAMKAAARALAQQHSMLDKFTEIEAILETASRSR